MAISNIARETADRLLNAGMLSRQQEAARRQQNVGAIGQNLANLVNVAGAVGNEWAIDAERIALAAKADPERWAKIAPYVEKLKMAQMGGAPEAGGPPAPAGTSGRQSEEMAKIREEINLTKDKIRLLTTPPSFSAKSIGMETIGEPEGPTIANEAERAKEERRLEELHAKLKKLRQEKPDFGAQKKIPESPSNRQQVRDLRRIINTELPSKSALMREWEMKQREVPAGTGGSGRGLSSEAIRIWEENNANVVNKSVEGMEKRYGTTEPTRAMVALGNAVSARSRDLQEAGGPDIFTPIFTSLKTIADNPVQTRNFLSQMNLKVADDLSKGVAAINAIEGADTGEKAMRSLGILLQSRPFMAEDEEAFENLSYNIAALNVRKAYGNNIQYFSPGEIEDAIDNQKKIVKRSLLINEEGETDTSFIDEKRKELVSVGRGVLEDINRKYGLDLRMTLGGAQTEINNLPVNVAKALTTKLKAYAPDRETFDAALASKSGATWEWIKLMTILQYGGNFSLSDDRIAEMAKERTFIAYNPNKKSDFKNKIDENWDRYGQPLVTTAAGFLPSFITGDEKPNK